MRSREAASSRSSRSRRARGSWARQAGSAACWQQIGIGRQQARRRSLGRQRQGRAAGGLRQAGLGRGPRPGHRPGGAAERQSGSQQQQGEPPHPRPNHGDASEVSW